MAIRKQLEKIAAESGAPCVTISLNTHRTHPDNQNDRVKLKNYITEARKRVEDEFGKRPATELLANLEEVESEIDENFNLESLHLFVSNQTKEVVRSIWPVSNEGVVIADHFATRSMIKSYTRSYEYLVMLLSQSGVQLYEAVNDTIIAETENADFPFAENPHYLINAAQQSDPKQVDDMVREFLNKVDKAAVRVYQDTGLPCVVICTEDNYSRLLQVADQEDIYLGYAPIDYNNTATHQIVKQSWELVRERQKQVRQSDINEIQEAVGKGLLITDLQEIYQAAIDGRGDLLVVREHFAQAVMMDDERTFTLIDDPTQEGSVEDITSTIAWEVMAKNGRVLFLKDTDEMDVNDIALKVRY